MDELKADGMLFVYESLLLVSRLGHCASVSETLRISSERVTKYDGGLLRGGGVRTSLACPSPERRQSSSRVSSQP